MMTRCSCTADLCSDHGEHAPCSVCKPMGRAVKVMEKDGASGFGAVYRVEPPMPWKVYSTAGNTSQSTTHVWVHATDVPCSGPETYIFPCTEAGVVLDWLELDGSYRGGMNLTAALRGAGYEIQAQMSERLEAAIDSIGPVPGVLALAIGGSLFAALGGLL